MSVARAQTAAMPAMDLLACDEEGLVEYLSRNIDPDGRFDLSTLVSVRSLSGSQRSELGRRIMAAILKLQKSHDIDPNELHTLLMIVANKQDGSQSPDHRRLLPPPESRESRESRESTPLPTATWEDSEAVCYHVLIESGGRPVCSIQNLSHLFASPMTGYKAVLPWLRDHPDSDDGPTDIKTVFSRQLERWWDFRKSQWANRGISDSEEGFSAFLEANRRREELVGEHEWVSSPEFDETIRRLWQHRPASRQLPNGQGFRAYSEAVKRRLAPHRFTRPLQLKKNPHQQTTWTNWLEYLNYEQWWSEFLTVEERYLQPQRRLREALPCSSGPARTRQRPKPAELAEELEATRATLDATSKSIDDFIRKTERYTEAQTAAHYQRLRVKWAVEEARLMETEMSQQRRTAKSNTKVDTKENRKRRHGDDEAIPPEPWSMRTRRGAAEI